MVFKFWEKIKETISPERKGGISTKKLAKFSPAEQERILSRIAAKESEVLRKQADLLVEERVRRLEKSAGIKEFGAKAGKGIKSGFQKIREYRQANLARRARRQEEFKKKEKDFREGKLGVKPLAIQKAGGVSSPKLNVKPFTLKPRKL